MVDIDRVIDEPYPGVPAALSFSGSRPRRLFQRNLDASRMQITPRAQPTACSASTIASAKASTCSSVVSHAVIQRTSVRPSARVASQS